MPAAMAEILTQAKMAPLHLDAHVTKMSRKQLDAFKRQLEAHISHTRHLYISGAYLQYMLSGLISSAPTLESLTLVQLEVEIPMVVVPSDLFNGTTPSLTSLELRGCNISWKAPLLKGLQTLVIELVGPSTEERPNLKHWLDGLDQMPQLETLVFRYASPSASVAAPLISEPSRTVTLSSLTRFGIVASAEDCVLALTHLALPSLTWLHVEAESHESEGEDVQLLIPYIARNVYVLQGTEQLRSILVDGHSGCAIVHAWTTFNDPDLVRKSVPENLIFTARGNNWHLGVDTAILNTLLTILPLNSVSILTSRSITELSKEFWLSHVPRWPMLERASLNPTTIKAFRDMLAKDAPPDGPRLPSLTKLILVDAALNVSRAYDLRDMLLERVEQGAPLQVLDLRTCVADDRAIRLLGEIVVDVQEPLASRPSMRMRGRMRGRQLQSAWYPDTKDADGVEYDYEY